MRLYNKEVFYQAIAGTTEVFTSPRFHATLGAAEQLALHVRAEQTTGTAPTLTLRYYFSNDGVAWTPGASIGSAQPLTVGGVTSYALAVDLSAAPPGAYLRLGFALNESGACTRLCVRATGRAERLYA